MVEIVRTETVGEDGVLRFSFNGLEPGQKVEVTLREEPLRGYREPGDWKEKSGSRRISMIRSQT